MRSYQQFFAELKRRHVFKVAAIYGATAFVLLQLADLLGQGLQLPDVFLSMVTVLILLGFPLALIVTWAFELTPEGIRRTEPAPADELARIVDEPASKRWPSGLLALAGIAALVVGAWWVGRSGVTPPGGERAEAGSAIGESDGRNPPARLAYSDLRGDARPGIAVLPFVDMSPQGDQEYFSDGISEEILNTLARIPELRVAGRTSAFAYKDRDMDLREIGRELGVRYLVEGSVRKDGDQLRITAQLIDADDGSHLWSDQYDRTLQGVFAIQSEIATAVAEALRVPLGLVDPAARVAAVADFDAYDLYLAARARMRERGASLNEAVRLYEAAIAIDSSWAPAWAGLAEAREIRLWYGEPWGGEDPDSATIAAELAIAEREARHALTLDPRNASALVALGSVLRDRFEWQAAETAYLDALAVDPDNAEAHQQYAELLLASGRIAEAVLAADRAAVLDPAPVRFNVLASVLMRDERRADAKRALQRGIQLDPEETLMSLRGNMGWLHYDEGDYEGAARWWTPLWGARAEEERRELMTWARWMRSGDPSAFPDSARQYLQGEDWMMLGVPDSAAAILAERRDNEGIEVDWLYRIWLPQFDPIRSHPRIVAYLKSRNLEPRIERTPPGRREPLLALRQASVESPGAGRTDTP